MLDPAGKRLHFIGIGGVGMSGLARVAKDQGFRVSGSDLKEGYYTRFAQDQGIPIAIGHRAENLGEDDPIVIISTAIPQDNPELQAAKERGLQILHRSELLVLLSRDLLTLAVAGTHGKSTTSAMLAVTMDAMGLDPTALIGGTVLNFGSNAHSGKGDYYVVEADESDKSFLNLSPHAAIITNVEPDHLDHYRDFDEIKDLFGEFIASVPEEGVVIVGGDDAVLLELAKKRGKNVFSYGFGDQCDYVIRSVSTRGLSSSFTLDMPGGRRVEGFIPKNPGRHNVANGSAVLALLDQLGFDVNDAARALATFSGVKRRFDFVGEEQGITVLDDYAHHPTEIAATIKAARKLDFSRIHVLFQPHRYSRVKLFTEVLRDSFAHAFDEADSVTFMNIYAAGEQPIPGVNGETFLVPIRELGSVTETHYIPALADVAPFMAQLALPGDLIITMGAGDVTSLGSVILREIHRCFDTATSRS